jgi:hypothetical protein
MSASLAPKAGSVQPFMINSGAGLPLRRTLLLYLTSWRSAAFAALPYGGPANSSSRHLVRSAVGSPPFGATYPTSTPPRASVSTTEPLATPAGLWLEKLAGFRKSRKRPFGTSE